MTVMEHDAARPDGRPIPEAFAGLPEDFARAQLSALENALHMHGRIDGAALGQALAVVAGIRPGDEIEALIAAQMALTHGLVLEWLGKSRRATLDRERDRTTNLAVKLMRTATTQATALARLKNAAARAAPRDACDESGHQPHAKGRARAERPASPAAAGSRRQAASRDGARPAASPERRDRLHATADGTALRPAPARERRVSPDVRCQASAEAVTAASGVAATRNETQPHAKEAVPAAAASREDLSAAPLPAATVARAPDDRPLPGGLAWPDGILKGGPLPREPRTREEALMAATIHNQYAEAFLTPVARQFGDHPTVTAQAMAAGREHLRHSDDILRRFGVKRISQPHAKEDA